MATEVKKNTISMELLATYDALVSSSSKQLSNYLSLQLEIGKILKHFFILTSIESSDQLVMSTIIDRYKYMKKYLIYITSIYRLPSQSSISRQFRQYLHLQSSETNRYSNHYEVWRRLITNNQFEKSNDDDDLFTISTINKSNRFSNDCDDLFVRPIRNTISNLISESDDLFTTVINKNKRAVSTTNSKRNEQLDILDDSKYTNLYIQPSNYLSFNEMKSLLNQCIYQLIIQLLNIKSNSISKIQKDIIVDEINYNCISWRKSNLLFDYYFMHSVSKSDKHSSSYQHFQLIKRVFHAMYSIPYSVNSNDAKVETIDDIRYFDKGNVYHLQHISNDVMTIWMNNNITIKYSDKSTNTSNHSMTYYIPGYNDPQTLFMFGDDCNTCMSIRSKQKATNRGLLSILLHGNTRILGIKDKAGRLIVRAVCKLLIDETTMRPVIYVDNPIGSGSDELTAQIYDQARELSELLQLPVVYASIPSQDLYILSEMECGAIPTTRDGESNDLLVDYTYLAPFHWIDGLKDPISGNYLPQSQPKLIKRSFKSNRVIVAARPKGFIEMLKSKCRDKVDNSLIKLRFEDIVDTQGSEYFDESTSDSSNNSDELIDNRDANINKPPLRKSSSVQERQILRKAVISEKIQSAINRRQSQRNPNYSDTTIQSSDSNDDLFG